MPFSHKTEYRDFSADLRVSYHWILGMLVIIGISFFQAGDAELRSSQNSHMDILGLVVFGSLIVLWFADSLLPVVARPLAIIVLVFIIFLSAYWLEIPLVLTLLVLPMLMMTAIINLTAGAGLALGITLLLIVFESTTFDGGLTEGNITLFLVWGCLGIMVIVYRPIYNVAQWAWEYYQQAHEMLDDAQTQKMELAKALDDLTHANLQLTRMHMMAQGLRRAAEQAHTAKAEFVANVSHELRTPLNMITGFSEMILQSPDIYGKPIPPTLLADLTVIYRNAEHLAHLIDDVLDLSQIDADQMALTRERTNLSDIVHEAIIAVRPLFESRSLYLDVNMPDKLPSIYCDRTRIREVLLNLLSNAGRYTEQGGVHVEVTKRNQVITVAVSDTGPGIAPENLQKLFQPFTQVDGSSRRKYGGTGLGLNISKRFVELHGGKIWVESTPGQGTVFSFELPITVEPLSMSESWRQIVPDWEYVERLEPSKAPKPARRPRFVVVEAGNALSRLLRRYWDEVDIAQVTRLSDVQAELTREPAQAILVNDLSVSDTLHEVSTMQLSNDGTPTIICSLPDMADPASSSNTVMRLVKPISRDQLLGTLKSLGVIDGTILIVDDEPDALHLFGRILSTSDYQYRILLARDGEEALAILAETRPDVMLLDLVMPKMDGFQVLKQCSQDAELRRIPVIIISAKDPMGQPIVSKTLAVTQSMGFSVSQLLRGIEVLSRYLSSANQLDDSMPIKTLNG